MQLPGYFKGRALQEWHLLSRTDQQSYPKAVDALCSRLDSINRTLAAKKFWHLLQQREESVAGYIRRLEKAYQVAYGKDSLPPGTRDDLLYTQMYNGLRYDVMHGSAMSRVQGYRELCVAARGEEHRLAALHQRQQFQKSTEETTSHTRWSTPAQVEWRDTTQASQVVILLPRRCMVPLPVTGGGTACTTIKFSTPVDVRNVLLLLVEVDNTDRHCTLSLSVAPS